jgi:aspartyl-tRNA synthetase
VAGWIEDFRDIGKLGFIMLRDVSGLVQTVLKGEHLQKKRINNLLIKLPIGKKTLTIGFDYKVNFSNGH